MSMKVLLVLVVTLTAVLARSVTNSEDDGIPRDKSLMRTMGRGGHDSLQEDDGGPRGASIRKAMFGHDSMQERDLNTKRLVQSISARDYQENDKEQAIANAIGSLDEMLEKQSHPPFSFKHVGGRDALAELPMRLSPKWQLSSGDQHEDQQVDDEDADALEEAADEAALRRRALYARAYKRASLAMQTKRRLEKRFLRDPPSLSFRGRDQFRQRLDEVNPPRGGPRGVDSFRNWRGRDATQRDVSNGFVPSSLKNWRGRDALNDFRPPCLNPPCGTSSNSFRGGGRDQVLQ